MQIITTIFAVILAINQEIGLYAMAFFLPVINWGINYGGLEVPFIDLLGLAVGVIFALKQSYIYLFDRQNFKIGWPVFLSFSLFFAAAVVSTLLADNAGPSLWYAVRWILFFYLIYLFVPYNLINRKKILKNVLLSFTAVSILVGLIGLASLFYQDWQNDFVRIKPLGLSGIYPIGDNQNLLAEVLLVGIFFTLALKYFYSNDRQARAINLLVGFLAVILIGTFSRAAWVVLLAQLAAYFFYKKEFFKKAWLPALAVILALTPVFYYMSVLQSQYRIGVSSTENRWLLTQISYDSFKDKPWFGQGSGNFINLVADNVRFTAKYGAPLDSHGLAQKILAENGLIGILAFGVFSLAIILIFYRALKIRGPEFSLLLPLIIGALGVYLFEFFNTSYYKGKLWLPIAVALAAVNLAKAKKLYDQKN